MMVLQFVMAHWYWVIPAAVAAITIGWPWRYIARTGLISATAACLAYVLWCYFFAAALWRPTGID